MIQYLAILAPCLIQCLAWELFNTGLSGLVQYLAIMAPCLIQYLAVGWLWTWFNTGLSRSNRMLPAYHVWFNAWLSWLLTWFNTGLSRSHYSILGYLGSLLDSILGFGIGSILAYHARIECYWLIMLGSILGYLGSLLGSILPYQA